MNRPFLLVGAWLAAAMTLLAGCSGEGSGSGGAGGGTPCSSAKDCPASECAHATCKDGYCEFTPNDNGSEAPTQTAGDCRKNICAGGEVIEVEDSSDAAEDDGTLCTLEVCTNLKPGTAPAPLGAPCSDGGGKVCDGAGKCVACVADGDCGEGMKCSAAHACVPSTCGNGVKDGDETDVDCGGACGATCEAGQSCSVVGDCLSAHCADGVCCDTACTGECEACAASKTGGKDGTCAPVTAGTDPENECDPGVECGNSDGLCSGEARCNKAAAGTPCGQGPSCQDDAAKAQDACDGLGACLTGATVPCDPYVCGATSCKDTCATNADCVTGSSCDGVECSAVKVLGEACVTDAACQSGFCTDGVCCDAACDGPCEACSAAKKGSGADGTCGAIGVGTDPDLDCPAGQVCDGAGACAGGPGQGCAQNTECASDFCADGVCCDTACGGLCNSCLQAQTGQPDGVCKPIVGGLDPASECPAAQVCNGMGACMALANGVACVGAVDCLSGFCVDGFCCDNACDTTCRACATAKKGSGANGACGPIATNNDPDDECPGVTACNGGGACNLLAAGLACSVAGECATAFCVDGVCCNNACTGLCQACSAAKKGSGSGTCGPVAVGTDPDNECAGVLACDGAMMMSSCKTPDGQACSANAECVSGFCADGVCCNTACGGACQACTSAKKGAGANGVCGNIQNGLDPDSECGGATVCNGAGACALLANGASCSAGNECLSTFCSDGVCCNNACTAVCEACTFAKKGSGADGTCAAIATGTDPDNECTGALVCAPAGQCKLVDGTACSVNSECISGFCADGVCCNAACGGLCQACTAAKKGTGANGVCGNILNSTDPDNECGGATSCNGSGACALLPIGSACSLASECQSVACVDGFCCNAACTDVCQACSAAKKGSGTNGTCANIGTGTDPDSECTGTDVCNGSGVCKTPQGEACSQNAQCLSGFCVDGVCCNTACNTLCQACSAAKKGTGPGTDGACGSVAANTDPDSECPGVTNCNGATCQLLAAGASCSINAECSSNFCVDGVCCTTQCSGTCQACSAAKKGSGSDGSCGPIAAGTDPDNECAGAQNCNGAGVCQ